MGILDNKLEKFEGLGKNYEGRDGAFDIMSMRFTIVRSGLINAENSPTIAKAMENVQRLEAAADALAYKQEVQRIAEATTLGAATNQTAPRPVPESSVQPDSAFTTAEPAYDQQRAIADAQTLTQQARDNNGVSHNYGLKA